MPGSVLATGNTMLKKSIVPILRELKGLRVESDITQTAMNVKLQ